ncbi:MAG: hypothetical protein Q7V17_07150 [Afipia sp.]|nr:hypothetical protein [Afipia sp.]
MNILQDIERKIIRLKEEVSIVRADLKFRKLAHAIKAGFNPDQPRDEDGRWTGTGSSNPDGKPGLSLLASYSSIAECNFQYKRDLFQCKIVGLRACYAQAMERLSACERGKPIPPLNY